VGTAAGCGAAALQAASSTHANSTQRTTLLPAKLSEEHAVVFKLQSSQTKNVFSGMPGLHQSARQNSALKYRCAALRSCGHESVLAGCLRGDEPKFARGLGTVPKP
jgi:hypothetical protein